MDGNGRVSIIGFSQAQITGAPTKKGKKGSNRAFYQSIQKKKDVQRSQLKEILERAEFQ